MSIIGILARKAAELRDSYERRLRKLDTYIAKDNLKGKDEDPERKAERKRTLLLFNKADSFLPSIGGHPQCLSCWMRCVRSSMEEIDNPDDDAGKRPYKWVCPRCKFDLDDPSPD